MVETGYLTNHFLFATPYSLDPSFFFTALPTRTNTNSTIGNNIREFSGEAGRM
jgi:hypothetical protein